MIVKVFDKRTKREREVQLKAYQLLKNRYELLSEIPEQAQPVQKKSEVVKAAEPVAVKRQPRTPEEIEAKKKEIADMNEAAAEKVRNEAAQKELNKTTNAKV